MVQAPSRTAVRGSTFVRLLARLTDIDSPPSSLSLSQRMGQWLDWNQAIALSTALDGKPAPLPSDVPPFDDADEREYARVRNALAGVVNGARELAFEPRRGAGPASAVEERKDAAVDYAPFRQRYVVIQRSMQSTAGNLRARFRDMLAGKSPSMARLAEVDAALELVLGPREQKVLGTVPALLGNHFERLRQAGAEAADTASAASSDTWLDVFRRDMRNILLAELDVRFQPVEGLLAALRAR